MTINELRRRFPNASASTLAANHCEMPPAKEATHEQILGLKVQPTSEKLNKTEAAFREILIRENPEHHVFTQAVTLKLGDDCRYTPDFAVIPDRDGGVTIYEVKGFWRDDAKVKIKVAARMFRAFKFVVVMKAGPDFTRIKVNP